METFRMMHMASYFGVVYHNVVLYQENKVADLVYCLLLVTLVTLCVCSLN